MEQIISSIKRRFAEEGGELKKSIPSLEAIFCIGSAANNRTFKNEGYQDFDIHFYLNKSFLNRNDLDSIKEIFRKTADSFKDQNTAIDYCIKDKPWKMAPKKLVNIGFHGTLLNRLDYLKRIGPNHILALNMFDNSETLFGRLVYPQKPILNDEFLTQAGGIGWLKENFYRLANVLDPAKEAMAVPIREVAVYFGLSPLIHYYYLCNGKTATREKSHAFFLDHKLVPKKAKEAAEFIYGLKNGNNAGRQQDSFPLMEAAYTILKFVEKSFAKPGTKAEKIRQNTSEDENSELISALTGRRISVKSAKSWFFAQGFAEALMEIKKNALSFSNVSPDEYFETLNNLLNNSGINEVNRVYFFEQGDPRADDPIDFSRLSFPGVVYSWEKGIATYVQRLNELYLNSATLTENDLMLAKILVSVSLKEYSRLRNEDFRLNDLDSKLGFLRGFSLEDRYFRCLEFLAGLGDSVINEIDPKL